MFFLQLDWKKKNDTKERRYWTIESALGGGKKISKEKPNSSDTRNVSFVKAHERETFSFAMSIRLEYVGAAEKLHHTIPMAVIKRTMAFDAITN